MVLRGFRWELLCRALFVAQERLTADEKKHGAAVPCNGLLSGAVSLTEEKHGIRETEETKRCVLRAYVHFAVSVPELRHR